MQREIDILSIYVLRPTFNQILAKLEKSFCSISLHWTMAIHEAQIPESPLVFTDHHIPNMKKLFSYLILMICKTF